MFEHINDVLRTRVRAAEARDEEPLLGIIDSQSVKTTEAGGPRGYDAGKKVKRRKRHVLVDVLGLLVVVFVTVASRASASKADQYRSLGEEERQLIEGMIDCLGAEEADLACS